MNKKKLSVVMAGAMLATSVAPVLAAPVEMGLSQKALLKKEVMDLVNSKIVSSYAGLKDALYTDSEVSGKMDADRSAYGLKVLDEKGKEIKNLKTAFSNNTNLPEKEVTFNVKGIEYILDNLKKDYTIQIVERENSKFLGQVIPGSEIVPGTETKAENKYKVADFEDADTFKTNAGIANVGDDKFVKEVEVDAEAGTAKITLTAVKDLTAGKAENIVLDVKLGDTKYDFNLPLDAEGNLITDSEKIMECVGFHKKVNHKVSKLTVEDTTLVKEYKLIDDSKKHEEVTLLSSDLYDGFALTAKGTEIKSDVLNAAKVAKETEKAPTVELGAEPTALTNGVASFTVTYFASHKDNDTSVGNTGDKPSKVVTIKSTNLKELQSLYKMLKEKVTFSVGIVGGDNRYETAVNVAKHQGITAITGTNADSKGQNNIVLVNGESLVDGLAAAPLAASLKWNNDTNPGTAVLLSKTDSLAKETKEYLESLVVNVSKSKLKNIKIHLVGGESVLSESLVEELKGMGFSVERYGGNNREETSLEVAEAVETINNETEKGAFIVGGNGEADAMSIAARAAETKTPIIVSSVHGLTNDVLKHIEKRDDKKITIIGGEGVVSAEEYAKLDALTKDDNAVERISGENRFETNAAVIERFYKGQNANGVVLVKDGMTTKNELIDALSAANYASGMNAPIVLASTSLKDGQKNALLNVTVPKTATIAQVGIGAERTVLETIAGLFGISNVK